MSKMNQCYGIGQALINTLPPPLLFGNAPGASDTNFEIGQIVYTGSVGAYTFYLYAGAGVWELLDIATGALDTLTGDSGTAVPAAGNIKIAGTTAQVSTAASGSTVTLSLVGPYTPATYTAHGVLIGEAATSIHATSAGSAGQILTSGGASADPTWTTATFPATAGATGTILRSNGTNYVASTDTWPDTVVAGDILIATATNAIGSLADVATGQVLMSGGVGVIPAYSGSPSVSGSVTAGTGLTATTGGVTVNGGDIINAHSNAGTDVTIEVTNSDNTNGASRAGVEIATGGASSGDPYLSFQISGVGASTMTMGLDNSVSDTFVISNSTTIGTSNALTLTQAGALTATTTLTATSGAITATNGSFTASTAGTGILLNSPNSSGIASSPVVVNGRSGRATFTSVSIAAAADLTLTLTNSSITASSTILMVSMSGATTGSALSIKSITNTSGSSAIVVTNGTGATTTTADIQIDFLVINA